MQLLRTAEYDGSITKITSIEVVTDHANLFVEVKPKWSPAEIAKQFNDSLEIKQRYC